MVIHHSHTYTMTTMSELDDVDLIRNISGHSGVSGASASYSGQQKPSKTARDKSKYLLSIGKRPRKNVKKRFADEMKPLRAIGEDEEVLINDDEIHSSAHDQYRAPKAALGIFLFVVSIGSYQLLVDYWNAQELAATNHAVSTVFMGLSNNETGFGQDGIQPPETDSIADTPITTVNGTLDVPKVLDTNLANVFHEQFDPSIHKLYLWHIPRSGSTTIKRIAANCLGLTLASEAGKSEVGVRGPESTLKIVEGADGMHFANVDMSFPDGIAHAHSLHVGEDHRIDVVSSAYLHHTAGIFNPNHKGYMFAMMRHPIERAVSLFHNMRRYPQYAQVIGPVETVEMYAKSSLVENNWMTRFLSDKLGGQLGPEHEVRYCKLVFAHFNREIISSMNNIFSPVNRHWRRRYLERNVS